MSEFEAKAHTQSSLAESDEDKDFRPDSERVNAVNAHIVRDVDSRRSALLDAGAKQVSSLRDKHAKQKGILLDENGNPIDSDKSDRAKSAVADTHKGSDEKALPQDGADPDPLKAKTLRQYAASSFVDELEESDELQGSRDVYDASRAVRHGYKSIKGKYTGSEALTAEEGANAKKGKKSLFNGSRSRKGALNAGSSPATSSSAKRKSLLGKTAKKAKGARSAKMAQAAHAKQAAQAAQAVNAARAAASAKGAAAAMTAGASTAAVPVAGVFTGMLIFVITILAIAQIISAIFGFWENEELKQSVEGLPPYITTEMVEEALACQEEYGHPAGATIAQIICESGMGDHMSALATRDHNLFGMKWASSFAGCPEVTGSASWVTGEEYDGEQVTITDRFIVFKGDVECIRFRSRVFLQASHYKNNSLIQQSISEHSSDKMAEGLKDAGWATSSSYVESLKSTLQTYNLYRFDEMSLEDFKNGVANGDAIVKAAYSQLGTPYKWGGITPGVGLDCSGLTQYCYKQAGISIPRTTEDQKSAGRVIAISAAQPGDILYKYGHVGIYIGDDKYIYAPQTGDVVKISSGVSYFTCAISFR